VLALIGPNVGDGFEPLELDLAENSEPFRLAEAELDAVEEDESDPNKDDELLLEPLPVVAAAANNEETDGDRAEGGSESSLSLALLGPLPLGGKLIIIHKHKRQGSNQLKSINQANNMNEQLQYLAEDGESRHDGDVSVSRKKE
jgi:hypothetical protein